MNLITRSPQRDQACATATAIPPSPAALALRALKPACCSHAGATATSAGISLPPVSIPIHSAACGLCVQASARVSASLKGSRFVLRARFCHGARSAAACSAARSAARLRRTHSHMPHRNVSATGPNAGPTADACKCCGSPPRTAAACNYEARTPFARRSAWARSSTAASTHGHQCFTALTRPHANAFGFFVRAEKHTDERRLCASREMGK